MAETIIEQATCDNCGADVRENTLFCYNCGKGIEGEAAVETVADQPAIEVSPLATAESNGLGAEEMTDETRSALDDLAEKLKSDDADKADRMAQAAAERKKARVKPRKKAEIVWEAEGEGVSRLFVLLTLLIFVITGAVVFLMVYWK